MIYIRLIYLNFSVFRHSETARAVEAICLFVKPSLSKQSKDYFFLRYNNDGNKCSSLFMVHLPIIKKRQIEFLFGA
tara:strand:- start:301 stop:528 length:228 start_codon:yes stop_codon:yes gene_type:complete